MDNAETKGDSLQADFLHVAGKAKELLKLSFAFTFLDTQKSQSDVKSL